MEIRDAVLRSPFLDAAVSVLVHLLALGIFLEAVVISRPGGKGHEIAVYLADGVTNRNISTRSPGPVPDIEEVKRLEKRVVKITVKKPAPAPAISQPKIPMKTDPAIAPEASPQKTDPVRSSPLADTGPATIPSGIENSTISPDTVTNGTDQSSDVRGAGKGVNDSNKIYSGDFGGPEGPRFAKRISPRYPLMARQLGKEGKVLLKLFIDRTGRLVDLQVLEKAGFGFDVAALEAVRQSTFLPATRNGNPVDSQSMLSVKFELRDE